MTDDFDDRQFQKVVTEGLVPKVEGSSMFVSISPGVDRIDAKFCVELGVAIMLDKPILAIVAPDQTVPRKLHRIAEMIVIADITTDEGRQRVAQAIQEFQKNVLGDSPTSDED
jgi:hypothetical protein